MRRAPFAMRAPHGSVATNLSAAVSATTGVCRARNGNVCYVGVGCHASVYGRMYVVYVVCLVGVIWVGRLLYVDYDVVVWLMLYDNDV